MSKYIDVVLTQNGVFCVAPPWVVKEGDLVSLMDNVALEIQILEAVAVVTDKVDGAYISMVEKYTGYPLPRITAKYSKKEVVWDEQIQE